MNKFSLRLTFLSLILAINCTNKKDMSLYINDNLNDSTHVGNLKVKETKSEVLEKVKEFDKWYRAYTGDFLYVGDNTWNVGGEYDPDNKDRIKYLKDSIIPRMLNCPLISDKLKGEVKKRMNAEDPENAGVLLSGSEYGRSIQRLTLMLNSDEHYGFHTDYLLNDDDHEEDVDSPLLRDISYEEAEFYHLSFIKLLDEDEAIYRVNIDLTGGYDYKQGFLMLKLLNKDGEWLVDDMYYIEEEELIEREAFGYTLLDYFSNKEGYETGKPKP